MGWGEAALPGGQLVQMKGDWRCSEQKQEMFTTTATSCKGSVTSSKGLIMSNPVSIKEVITMKDLTEQRT